jgi:hypothetical protein
MQNLSQSLERDEDILYLNPAPRSYILLFEDDSPPFPVDSQQVVFVKSIEEAMRFLQLLGASCELCLSPEYRMDHPELDAAASEIALSDTGNEAPFDIETAAVLMRKLPLDLKSLLKSPIALVPGDPKPPLIANTLVHKQNSSNVLISEHFETGWIKYFNMFLETDELKFDHVSHHVQGMLMIEALRQAGIACAHLQGLPEDGMLALMEYTTNFFSFVECNSPIILRAYCSFTADETSKDKEACIYLQVMQWGKVCAEATLKAFACMSSNRCQEKEERIQKISCRHKSNFQSKFSRLLEMEKAG